MYWLTRIVLVLFVAGAVSSCALHRGYQDGRAKANEAYLQTNLETLRNAIKKYTSDKGKPPPTLEELVEAEYITHIPRDPVTDEPDWIIVRYDCAGSANCKQGIKDIHSSATTKSTKGSRYADW